MRDRRLVQVASVLARPRASKLHRASVSETSRRAWSEDRTVLFGIVHVIRNGLRWRNAPAEYGPHKTLHNWFARGSLAKIG
ncbi:transposase [Ruegeria marina]|uniref:transposase n=1 Tax=Ruegeria marina TaxID=639004 RepID=UPI000B80B384